MWLYSAICRAVVGGKKSSLQITECSHLTELTALMAHQSFSPLAFYLPCSKQTRNLITYPYFLLCLHLYILINFLFLILCNVSLTIHYFPYILYNFSYQNCIIVVMVIAFIILYLFCRILKQRLNRIRKRKLLRWFENVGQDTK